MRKEVADRFRSDSPRLNYMGKAPIFAKAGSVLELIIHFN